MSIQTKLRFKNIGRIVGGVLFALILFTNIKVVLVDETDLARGDISLLGIEVGLFESTFGEDGMPERGMIWCIGTYGNYWTCLENATTYHCGDYLPYCA